MSIEKKEFMEHVGGLRGLAILLVIFYHLGNMGFTQGFLGVDIFLVLFGFFMLKHFVCDEVFDFKPGEYLSKRFCRLYPPFLCVSLAALVLGAVFFPYTEMLQAGRAGFSALLGFSNYWLDKTETGYFAESTRTNPFMHTWYFSIIVQSCVLYALLAWIMRGTKRWVRIAVLVLVLVVSFSLHPILYFWNQNCHPSTRTALIRYYWLAPRLWEVAAGGLLYLLPQIKSQHVRCSLWIASIAAIVVLPLFRFQYVEPAYLAVVAGTAALVCYTPDGVLRKLLANRFLVYTGKISYSLFLVHWLLIAFTIYETGHEPTLVTSLLIIAFSYGFAALLYYAIESQPCRLLPSLACWAGVGCASAAVVSTSGFRDYLHQDVNHAVKSVAMQPGVVCMDNYPEYADYPSAFIEVPCPFGGVGENWLGLKRESGSIFRLGMEGTPSFVVLGDSHAQAMAEGLHGIARQNGLTGIYLHTYVMPLWNYCFVAVPHQYVDKEKTEALLAWLGAHKELQDVVLTSLWAVRFKACQPWQPQNCTAGAPEVLVGEALRTFCIKLRELGKHVIILADNPMIGSMAPEKHVYRCLMQGRAVETDLLSCTREKYDMDNEAALAALARIQVEGLADVFYPSDCLFEDGVFKAYDGECIYMADENHLSRSGVWRVLQSVEKSLVEKLKR